MGVRQLPRRQQSGLRGGNCGSLEWEVGQVCSEVRPGVRVGVAAWETGDVRPRLMLLLPVGWYIWEKWSWIS